MAATIDGFQNSDSGGNVVTSLSCQAPAGISAGDLLLICVISDDSTNTTQFTTAASGWTKGYEYGNATYDAHIAYFWKLAEVGDIGVAVTINAPFGDEMAACFMRISGHHETDPVSRYLASGNASGKVHTVRTGTALEDGTLIIGGLAFDGGDGSPYSPPSGWTELTEFGSGSGSADVDGCIVYVVRNFGESGNVTIGSAGSDTSVTLSIEILPVDPNKNIVSVTDVLTVSGGIAEIGYSVDVAAQVGALIVSEFAAAASVSIDIDANIDGLGLIAHDVSVDIEVPISLREMSLTSHAAKVDWGANILSSAASLSLSAHPIMLPVFFPWIYINAASSAMFVSGNGVAITEDWDTHVLNNWTDEADAAGSWSNPAGAGNGWTDASTVSTEWTDVEGY